MYEIQVPNASRAQSQKSGRCESENGKQPSQKTRPNMTSGWFRFFGTSGFWFFFSGSFRAVFRLGPNAPSYGAGSTMRSCIK